MAYRAPELFDVKTGITLDEKVDIWVSGNTPNHFLVCVTYRLSHLDAPCTPWRTHIHRLKTLKRLNKEARLPWLFLMHSTSIQVHNIHSLLGN